MIIVTYQHNQSTNSGILRISGKSKIGNAVEIGVYNKLYEEWNERKIVDYRDVPFIMAKIKRFSKFPIVFQVAFVPSVDSHLFSQFIDILFYLNDKVESNVSIENETIVYGPLYMENS